jgi:hypothetical protein
LIFWLAELEGEALDRRRAADEAFQLHAQHAGVEVHAGLAARGGQHEVVEVVDHGCCERSSAT